MALGGGGGGDTAGGGGVLKLELAANFWAWGPKQGLGLPISCQMEMVRCIDNVTYNGVFYLTG